jgi:hypothetical protein
MSELNWIILKCPECSSRRAAIITGGKKAKCADCGHVYKTEPIPEPEEPMPKARKKRTTAPGVRHRRYNGPAELAVDPVPPPDPRELGTLTRYTQEILAGGPRALIAARHKAAKLSAKFGEDIETQWCLTTPYLQQLANGVDPAVKGQLDDAIGRYSMTKRNRARARYALSWRPRFLAILALSKAPLMAARAAGVAINTVRKHRAADPDFELQYEEAEEHALQLLHDVTMKSAIEGECEPVYWQGIQVGHIKKYDNRLRIEMLRAHMPAKFKTPGSKMAIATGDNSQNMFICTPEVQAELIAARRATLERIRDSMADPNAVAADPVVDVNPAAISSPAEVAR